MTNITRLPLHDLFVHNILKYLIFTSTSSFAEVSVCSIDTMAGRLRGTIIDRITKTLSANNIAPKIGSFKFKIDNVNGSENVIMASSTLGTKILSFVYDGSIMKHLKDVDWSKQVAAKFYNVELQTQNGNSLTVAGIPIVTPIVFIAPNAEGVERQRFCVTGVITTNSINGKGKKFEFFGNFNHDYVNRSIAPGIPESLYFLNTDTDYYLSNLVGYQNPIQIRTGENVSIDFNQFIIENMSSPFVEENNKVGLK